MVFPYPCRWMRQNMIKCWRTAAIGLSLNHGMCSLLQSQASSSSCHIPTNWPYCDVARSIRSRIVFLFLFGLRICGTLCKKLLTSGICDPECPEGMYYRIISETSLRYRYLTFGLPKFNSNCCYFAGYTASLFN